MQNNKSNCGFRPQPILRTNSRVDIRFAKTNLRRNKDAKRNGLVGESGSGKTTSALAVARLVAAYKGTVSLNGQGLLALNDEQLRHARERLHLYFKTQTNTEVLVMTNPGRNQTPAWHLRQPLYSYLCRSKYNPQEETGAPERPSKSSFLTRARP